MTPGGPGPPLAHREDLNRDLRTIIEKQTEPWGVQVGVAEIKDVEIPEPMQPAMAREGRKRCRVWSMT